MSDILYISVGLIIIGLAITLITFLFGPEALAQCVACF